MMKIRTLAPLLLLLVLAGCSQLMGPSASDYMDRNISVWNSLIAKFNEWSGGSNADLLNEKLEERKGLADVKFNLDAARTETVNMRDSMKLQPVPEDAQELHAKTMASLDSAVTWFDAMLKLTELPDGFTDAQAEPLLDAVDTAAGKFDTLTDELDVMQEAYAKKHHITLNLQPAPHAQ